MKLRVTKFKFENSTDLNEILSATDFNEQGFLVYRFIIEE